jgi:hypothetical protein
MCIFCTIAIQSRQPWCGEQISRTYRLIFKDINILTINNYKIQLRSMIKRIFSVPNLYKNISSWSVSCRMTFLVKERTLNIENYLTYRTGTRWPSVSTWSRQDLEPMWAWIRKTTSQWYLLLRKVWNCNYSKAWV